MASEPFFVINPRSAGGRTVRVWSRLRSTLEVSLGKPVAHGMTRGPMDAARLAARAVEQGHDPVVCLGGDGTVNEVLNGLLQASGPTPVFGYVPSGTGGDLARTLRLTGLTIEDHARRILHPTIIELDHGLARFVDHGGGRATRRFMNELSVGFSARTVNAVNRSSKLLGGRISFGLGVLRSLAGLTNFEVEILIEGEPWFRGDTFLVAVTNGKFFGGGMKIAPSADPDDGLFDVVVLPRLGRVGLLRRFGSIYDGSHVAMPGVSVTRGKVIELRCSEFLEMDGEQPGSGPVEIEVVPGLRVIA